MVILSGGQSEIVEGQGTLTVDQRQLAIGVHAHIAGLAVQTHHFGLGQLTGIQPQLNAEVAVGELVGGVCIVGVSPLHRAGNVGEVYGAVLASALGRRTGLLCNHLYAFHRAARRAVGDATAHGARGLGKANVGYVVGDFRTVCTFVNHRHAVVVIDARQRRVVVVGQIFVLARHAGELGPCLVFNLGGAAFHDVGLGIGGALQVDAPRQFHLARMVALRGIEGIEECAVADGALGEHRRVGQ